MAGQLVQISCPSDFLTESVALAESQCQELVELRAKVRRLERENLGFRRAGRILEESPSRSPAPHRRVKAKKSNNSKVRSGNSKPILQDDARKPSR